MLFTLRPATVDNCLIMLFKLILFYNAAKSGNATLRCMAKFNVEPLLVSHVEEKSEGLNPNAPPYDRLPPTDCFGEWNFRAGERFGELL